MTDANTETGEQNKGGSGGQVQRPAWLDSAPDAFKNNEAFYQFAEPKQFYEKADALIKAEKNMLVVPDKNAKPEDVAAFYAKLGRPDKPEGYSITKPADLPEDVPYDQNFETAFRQYAFEQGFTKAQAESAYAWYYGLVKNGAAVQKQQIEKAQTDGINALKNEWKDSFDGNKKIANIALKKFIKDEKAADDLLANAKIGNVRLGDHPTFMKVFYEIGKATLSDTELTGKDGGGGGAQGGGDADTKAATVMFPSMTKK